jgi:hypothetical protein
MTRSRRTSKMAYQLQQLEALTSRMA